MCCRLYIVKEGEGCNRTRSGLTTSPAASISDRLLCRWHNDDLSLTSAGKETALSSFVNESRLPWFSFSQTETKKRSFGHSSSRRGLSATRAATFYRIDIHRGVNTGSLLFVFVCVCWLVRNSPEAAAEMTRIENHHQHTHTLLHTAGASLLRLLLLLL